MHAVPGRRAGRLNSSWRTASGCAAGVVMPMIASWGHHSFLEDSPDAFASSRILTLGCDKRTLKLRWSRPVSPSQAECSADRPGLHTNMQCGCQECVAISIATQYLLPTSPPAMGADLELCADRSATTPDRQPLILTGFGSAVCQQFIHIDAP